MVAKLKWENLEKFLNIISTYDLDFQKCPKKKLYHSFKNNEYYILKNFCEINDLINMEYGGIELTPKGKNFFNFLKKMDLIYK